MRLLKRWQNDDCLYLMVDSYIEGKRKITYGRVKDKGEVWYDLKTSKAVTCGENNWLQEAWDEPLVKSHKRKVIRKLRKNYNAY